MLDLIIFYEISMLLSMKWCKPYYLKSKVENFGVRTSRRGKQRKANT